MEKRVVFLSELSRERVDLLQPEPHTQSFCGYCYPMAQKVFECEPGEEIEQLDYLAGLGLLERQFVDKVHLCPYCSHYALNFREICPSCESANIGIVEMIHHYQCGHVAPENDFQDGIRYTCPKCSKHLRHIGIDYERPNTNYLCFDCGNVFTEPQVSCLSLQCGQLFGIERAVMRTIYAYRLSQRGALTVERGSIEEIGFLGAFVDAELAIYTLRYFEEQLAQEMRRLRRYKRDLSMMMVRPDELNAYEEAFGREATASVFKGMTLVIKESLRDCDVPAIYGEDVLAILLPDTPVEGAHVAAQRIRQRIYELNPEEQELKMTVSIGLGGLKEELESPQALIDAASRRMEEARRAGGNCVRPSR